MAQCENEEEKLATENANLRKEVSQLNERLTQAEIRNGSRFGCPTSMLEVGKYYTQSFYVVD